MKFFYHDSGIYAHIDMQTAHATDIDCIEGLLRSFFVKARAHLLEQPNEPVSSDPAPLPSSE